MPRERRLEQDEGSAIESARPTAAPAAAREPSLLISLQQSAGNAAVARAIAAGGPSGPVLARNPFSKLFGGSKKKKGPTISGPMGGGAMTPEQQGGVKSMKQLIEEYEAEAAKAKTPGPEAPQPTPGLQTIVLKAQQLVAQVVGDGKTAPEVEKDEDEDEETGVSGMFDAFEKAYEEWQEKERQADEELYQKAKNLGAAVSVLKSPLFAKIGYDLLVAAVKAWNASPRRNLDLPQDKARRQELEALLAEKLWLVDADAVAAATLQPNPELLAKDQKGFFASKSVPLQEVLPDGKLSPSKVSFTNDQYFTTLTPLTVDGKDGYTVVAGGKTYWMPKDQVVEKTGSFEKVSGPLWPPDPEPAHVQQTTLGDCYLQASVASLAAANPGLVKAMMVDNGDDTVTVRLYKVTETAGQKSFSPTYTRVEKSVPKNFKDQEVYNKGALWVRLLEKAYAAGGFTGRIDRAPPAKKSYEGIASGLAEHAMEVLTGKPMEAPWDRNKDWHTKVASKLPWDDTEVASHAAVKLLGADYVNLLSHQILKDEAKVDTWIAFVKTGTMKAMFKKRDDDVKAGFAGDTTLKDLQDVMAPLSSDIRDAIVGWAESKQLYPGVLGSAKYSQTQLDLFKKVKDALDGGGMVTLASRKFPGAKQVAGTGASGGEVQHRGIVGGHAFTVLATRSYSTTDPDAVGAGEFFFLKVRNPWGKYGRKYDWSKLGEEAGEAVEGGDGVSWLELSDLTRYFSGVNYG